MPKFSIVPVLPGGLVQVPPDVDFDELMRPDSEWLPKIHGGRDRKVKNFIIEYLFDFNPKAAAERMGYTEREARTMGQKLLRHLDPQALLKYRRETARFIVDEGALDAAKRLVETVNSPTATTREQLTAAIQVLEKAGIGIKQQPGGGITFNAAELAVNIWQQVNNGSDTTGTGRAGEIDSGG